MDAKTFLIHNIIPAGKTASTGFHTSALYRCILAFGCFLIVMAASALFLAFPTPAQAESLHAPLPQSQMIGGDTITNTGSSVYLPLILLAKTPPPPDPTPYNALYCSSGSFDIPDDDPKGAVSDITINDGNYLLDVQVYLDIKHAWMGDVEVDLSHSETGKNTSLLNRPGYPADSDGCNNANARVILDDRASQPIENQCEAANLAASGAFQPNDPLQAHYADSARGTWSLKAIDNYPGDKGRINRWCLDMTLTAVQPGTYTPPPVVPVPAKARVRNVPSGPQSLPLDCESRSAVDWARYFGTPIGEFEFFNALPVSDNPDLGFVGDVRGDWGQIPPYDYGVHARPVAKLLRDYGLEAYAHRRTSWNQVQAEIAAGRPVIAWIIGNYYSYYLDRAFPTYYVDKKGGYTVVAPYEHTVLVTGYNETNVYILDQGNLYTPTLDEFLDTWAVLENMAVFATQ